MYHNQFLKVVQHLNTSLMQEALALKRMYPGIDIVINYKVITVFITNNSFFFVSMASSVQTLRARRKMALNPPKMKGVVAIISARVLSCRNSFALKALLAKLKSSNYKRK